MKVPIETEDEAREEARQEQEGQDAPAAEADVPAEGADDAAEGEADDADAVEPEPELDEEAMVAEAIRRGEEAAEADLRADADKVRRERDELATRLDEAEQAVEKARADAAEALERLARLQADWENYRRRTAAERLAERERATEKLVTALLPVLDDMERAIDHARSQELDEAFSQFVDGVDAVHSKMLDVFAHEGVETIDPKGEAFNPLEHQAVGRVEDAEAYDETVHDVYQKGYRMADRILRSAMVTVTYGGAKRPAPEPEAADAAADGTEAPADGAPEGTEE